MNSLIRIFFFKLYLSVLSDQDSGLFSVCVRIGSWKFHRRIENIILRSKSRVTNNAGVVGYMPQGHAMTS